MRIKQIAFPFVYFIKTCIFFVVFCLIYSLGITSPVLADDLCGDGYECWPESGGNAALYSWCELSSTEQYCQGMGTKSAYCSCGGSVDCSCTIGPGTTCENPIIELPDYYCEQTGEICQPVHLECDPVPIDVEPYEEYQACITDGETWKICPAPQGYSNLGCCYRDTVDPTSEPSPPPPPSATPDPTPSTIPDPTPSCGIYANGSPTDITTHFDYDIAWTSIGAESCTLYRNGSSIETTISGNRTEPADTNGTFNYLFSCNNLCAASTTDRRRQSFNSGFRFTLH